MFSQTKKTLNIFRYVDEIEECIKPVLTTFAKDEPNHENPPFPMVDA